MLLLSPRFLLLHGLLIEFLLLLLLLDGSPFAAAPACAATPGLVARPHGGTLQAAAAVGALVAARGLRAGIRKVYFDRKNYRSVSTPKPEAFLAATMTVRPAGYLFPALAAATKRHFAVFPAQMPVKHLALLVRTSRSFSFASCRHLTRRSSTCPFLSCRYAGRVAALADAARSAGLEF